MPLNDAAKKRLVGAATLVALVVIFVPMLIVDNDRDGFGEPIEIPLTPEFNSRFDSLPPALPDPFVPQRIEAPPRQQPREPERAEREPSPPREPEPPPAREPERSAPLLPRPQQPAPEQRRPPPATGELAWVVQVASVTSAESAEQLRDQLKQQGYPAFIESATVGDNRFHRVRVGPETDRERAEQMATQISRIVNQQPLVQRYP